MKVREINPHLRFASALRYVAKRNTVKVTDCRVFYVTEDSARLYINDQTYELIPHSLFYCSAGSEYSIKTDRGVSLLCFDFDLDQTHNDQVTAFPPCVDREKWDTMPVYFTPVEDSFFLNDHLYLADARELAHYAESIVAEFSGDAPFCRELGAASMKALLTELHRYKRAELPPKIAMIREYIQNHYAENITNKDLAALAGYHEYYLNRYFAACTGDSLHSYLLKVRLAQAGMLILNTDLELKAIPELVGFRSYPHFSSYFKQAYGCAPAVYRKRLKGSI